MKLYFTVVFLLCMALLVNAESSQRPHFVVAADGSGNFLTVQEAINAIPDLRKEETVVFIKKGTYKEKLILPATKTNVTFVGEDRAQTIITYDDYAQKQNRFGENIGTSGSSSFFIFGDGFTAVNITFENSAGPIGQAVAVRVTADRVSFFNCWFLGNQDTLYPHGTASRQYYKNCYIEGTVDFIFGASTAVFDSCTIFAKRGGYITAASTPETAGYGFVFLNCHITGSAPAGTVYLGRPWRNYAKTVFIECVMDSIVHEKGWHDWNKPEAQQTTLYAEYNCSGPGAGTSQRVVWSKQLTDLDRQMYTLSNIFKEIGLVQRVNDNWMPAEKPYLFK